MGGKVKTAGGEGEQSKKKKGEEKKESKKSKKKSMKKSKKDDDTDTDEPEKEEATPSAPQPLDGKLPFMPLPMSDAIAGDGRVKARDTYDQALPPPKTEKNAALHEDGHPDDLHSWETLVGKERDRIRLHKWASGMTSLKRGWTSYMDRSCLPDFLLLPSLPRPRPLSLFLFHLSLQTQPGIED
jgi:hypothetical protein